MRIKNRFFWAIALISLVLDHGTNRVRGAGVPACGRAGVSPARVQRRAGETRVGKYVHEN
ncbi:MAG: hypothetical protein GDA56_12085 [Hormoscilla sp. GM7CHS1pb]|nr:hypothetical protein [Hormoscilla sp. GM7CHS1pb]